MSLKFGDLLARALQEWPAEIDLKHLVRSSPTSTGYTVRGLAEISDAIEAQHIGVVDEIIMRNLHCVIYEVVHAAAAYVIRIKVSELRPETVRQKLDRNVRDCMEMPDLGYPPDAIALGKRYFTENGTEG
ncbi:hypothetical protein PQR36_02495 [Paraburkholderia nemoris]|uniref:hypothetical protein n=1 Tax=Paraburkholderia nemoris TaxID=2793076 RepID=UPI0038B75CDE